VETVARVPAIVTVCLGLCAATRVFAQAPSAESTAIPVANAEQIQQTVDRATAYLQAESNDWWTKRQCAACHHLPMPLWAFNEADNQGYAIDQKYLSDLTEAMLGSEEKLRATRIFPDPSVPPDPRPQGRGLNMGLPMLAVAAQSSRGLEERHQQSLQRINEEIVAKQQPDGSWEWFDTLRRPPINESPTTDAYWIIMALEGAMGPQTTESQRAALAKAIAWLDATTPTDNHQDLVLKVIREARLAERPAAMQSTIDVLLSLQRADGGWSQTIPEPKSDAFATGQTLYALALAGYRIEQPEIQRAVDFLVATQAEDGSWQMDSRSTPDGSPGKATLLTPINCAAASWATLGLVRMAPKGE
jgi:hypothetical protein